MKPEQTANAYDKIADRWNSNTFNRDNGIPQHERAIAFLTEKGTALDVGCGSSGRFIDLLRSHGFQVDGVDISGRMIELASTRHPDVTFHRADICKWQLPSSYDLITAWDSIWHIPMADQEPVMRKLMKHLNPGGVLIFTTGGVDQPEEKCDSSMGPKVYYSVPGIPALLKLIAESDCVCRHLEYDQYPELHLYMIAQKRC